MPQRFEGIKNLEQLVLDLDRAELRKVFVENKESHKEEHGYRAIYNVDRNETEAIMSDSYTLVQHTEAFHPLVQAMKSFRTDLFGFMTDEGGKVWIDVLLKDSKYIIIPADGKEINLGFRVSNTYDGSGAFELRAFGYRSYCDNGMIFGQRTFAAAYKVHKGRVEVDVFVSVLEKIRQMAPLLNAYISEAAKDFIETSELQAVLEELDIGKRYQALLMAKAFGHEHMSRWDLYNDITDFTTHELDDKKEVTRNRYHQIAEAVLVTPKRTLLERRRQ
jgi:hypothetical protein